MFLFLVYPFTPQVGLHEPNGKQVFNEPLTNHVTWATNVLQIWLSPSIASLLTRHIENFNTNLLSKSDKKSQPSASSLVVALFDCPAIFGIGGLVLRSILPPDTL